MPVPIVLDVWTGGARYVGLLPAALRTVLYGAAFWLSWRAGGALFRGAAGWSRPALMLAAGVAVAVMVFVVDFSVTSSMGDGSYVDGRCPGGHPQWWPL